MRAIISGATDFIGLALCQELRGDYELVALTRDARRAATIVKEWAKIEAVRRKNRKDEDYAHKQKFLVHFQVDQTRRLIGD